MDADPAFLAGGIEASHREFIAVLGSAAVWPIAADAQQRGAAMGPMGASLAL